MDLEFRSDSRYVSKERAHSSHHAIHVEVNMVASYCVTKVFGTLARVIARVLCAHIACMEDTLAELPRIAWYIGRCFGLPGDAPRIGDHLSICTIGS